jgi:hypothetical protein
MIRGALPDRVRAATRRAMFRVALAGTLCAVAIGLEHIARQAGEQSAAEAARALESVVQTQRADEARRLYATRYARLRARGHIGETSRPGVLEAVQESATRLGLRHLTFELYPSVVAGDVEMTRMTLQVGLLHEGELLRLFDQLRARAPAILWVRRCTLERSEPGTPSWRREADNLRAECLVEWLTVRAR